MGTGPDLLAQFTALEVATVSDALDACGLPPGQGGLRPMWGRPTVAGFAVTVELEPLSDPPDAEPGMEHGGAHILTEAIAGAGPEDVIVVDHGGLMAKFLALPCPRMFMYGEENAALSYLAKLAADGVELAEIPRSGHWPMYADPVAMWDRIAAFIR